MKKILHFAAALACGLCLMGTAARAEEGASPALQQPQELRAVYLAPGAILTLPPPKRTAGRSWRRPFPRRPNTG